MGDECQFSRERQLERLKADRQPWDIVVIGGGATGVGVAVDAATRGYRVALLERHDFGKGTSSRSTKLVHGGVRYLQQGHIHLVREALHERGLLRQNAPHLVYPLPTLVPVRSRWEALFYGLGLKVYDALSGRLSLGASHHLNAAEAVARIPTLATANLRGGILYYDAVFDDARLLTNLVQTAIAHGATCLNYAPVHELKKQSGRVVGVMAEDAERGEVLDLSARVVVNATGPFSDAIGRLDDPQAPPSIAPSQGIHLVFDRKFLPSDTAIVVPKTPDGRVIFSIPWHEHTVVGTTDTPLESVPLEPRPRDEEVAFLLETVAPYLSPAPQAADIRAIFAGIRPLVRRGDPRHTSKLARDHVIHVSASGLVSIMGGKWTTYRRMAEDCVDRAILVGGLTPAECTTRSLRVHGGDADGGTGPLMLYGSDAPAIAQLVAESPALGERLDERLPFLAAQAVWAARQEMARSVEDVLARRTRALFLDAEAALTAAPRVAALLAAELGRDEAWQADQLSNFRAVAENYRWHG